MERHREHARRGGALLELALFVPVLLYLLVAGGDFARYYVEASNLRDVAVQAARQAAVGEAPEERTPRADGETSVRIETFCACPAEPELRFACGAGSCGNYGEPARYVRAFAEKPFSFIARYPGVPPDFTMRRRAGIRTR